MEKIMLMRAVRTKNDKTMLIFLKPVSDKSTTSKGYTDNTQWIDGVEIFEKLDKIDFGKIVDANLGYTEPDYEGKCRLIIKDLIINGKQIKID